MSKEQAANNNPPLAAQSRKSAVGYAASVSKNPELKSVSELITRAVEQKGYRDLKECARAIGVPYDLLYKVVGGHIPKDRQLIVYANKLGIDERVLILTAYRERAPEHIKHLFNTAAMLDFPPEPMGELLHTVDTCNDSQLLLILDVARIIRGESRKKSLKILSLLELYQQMDDDLVKHFDSLVILALRNENLPAARNFRKAVNQANKKP